MIRRDRDLVPNRKSGPGRGDWLKGALIGLVLAFFVRLAVHAWFVFPLAIESADMRPTFEAGDSPYFLKWFDPADISRGDVVLLPHPENPDRYLVRRVVGLPGEQVQIHERRLFINNQPIELEWERTIQQAAQYPGPPLNTGSQQRDQAGPVIVPEGQLFVLGDNRAEALDSRDLGPLPVASVEALWWQ